MKDLKKRLKNLVEEMEKQIPTLDKEINSIINFKKENVEDIEKLLDILLAYNQFGIGEKNFFKLNNYYKTFMPDNAYTYEKCFKENFTEE